MWLRRDVQEESATAKACRNTFVDIGIPEDPGTNERITQGALSAVDGGSAELT